MPNYCNNVVEISHPDPAKLQEVIEAYNRSEFCSYAVPVPTELTTTMAGSFANTAQREAHEAQQKLNEATYGYKNWYDFCVSKWGTKWDCGPDGDPTALEAGQTQVTLSFVSAWAPPCGVYEALEDQGFAVRAYYDEPGMGFCGVWYDGDDDYYEYGGMGSMEVAELLPTELDEMFCISETVANFEEANEEAEEEDL